MWDYQQKTYQLKKITIHKKKGDDSIGLIKRLKKEVEIMAKSLSVKYSTGKTRTWNQRLAQAHLRVRKKHFGSIR